MYSVPQALAHLQIAQRGMVATFKSAPGVGRGIRIVRTGFKLNGEPPSVDTPPPTLGQPTAEVLAELGHTEDEVRTLSREKSI